VLLAVRPPWGSLLGVWWCRGPRSEQTGGNLLIQILVRPSPGFSGTPELTPFALGQLLLDYTAGESWLVR